MEQLEFKFEYDTSVIPEGVYCYDQNGLCPYWSFSPIHPSQMEGYCGYLNRGDWETDSIGHLWDQCKECGINEDDDDY